MVTTSAINRGALVPGQIGICEDHAPFPDGQVILLTASTVAHLWGALQQAVHAREDDRTPLTLHVAPHVTVSEPLTAREREVLALMARGLRNKEIADALFISPRTVKWHTQRLYQKLGVANRTEAVSLAWQRHLFA